MIGQSHQVQILQQHLEKYGIHVELNTELVGFEQNDDSVTARLLKRNGPEELSETVSVPLLVGADGARSQCHWR